MSYSPMENTRNNTRHSVLHAETISKPQQMPSTFYNSGGNQRGTSFGYGNKMSMARNTQAPSPGHYQIPSVFSDRNKPKSYSFSAQSKDLPRAEGTRKNWPGPGAFDTKPSQFQSSSYTIGERRSKSKVLQDPGPGKYEALGLSEIGHYYPSKFTNSRCCKIPQEKRFVMEPQRSPGPGAYNGDQKYQLNPEGVYHLAKYRNSGVHSFGRVSRDLEIRKSSQPGPGSYFSGFGFG